MALVPSASGMVDPMLMYRAKRDRERRTSVPFEPPRTLPQTLTVLLGF